MDDVFDAMMLLEKENMTRLIFSVYVHSHQRGFNLCLASGVSPLEMPWPILFFAANHDFPVVNTIRTRAEMMPNADLSEVVALFSDNDDDSDLHEAVEAKKLFLEYVIPEFSGHDGSAIMGFSSFDWPDSAYELILATIRDDLEDLTIQAAHPDFRFEEEIMVFAAFFGAIKCFRFMAINGCKYTTAALSASCFGGNEEIIQMCLENSCELADKCLDAAICSFNFDIIDWMINVRDFKPSTDHLITALRHCNYVFIAQYTHMIDIDFEEVLDSFPTIDFNRDKREIVRMFLSDHPDFHISAAGIHRIVELDDLGLVRMANNDMNQAKLIAHAARVNATTILKNVQHINAVDEDNQSALHYVFKMFPKADFDKTATVLVQFGLDIDIFSTSGESALSIACTKQCPIPSCIISQNNINHWNIFTISKTHGGSMSHLL